MLGHRRRNVQIVGKPSATGDVKEGAPQSVSAPLRLLHAIQRDLILQSKIMASGQQSSAADTSAEEKLPAAKDHVEEALRGDVLDALFTSVTLADPCG